MKPVPSFPAPLTWIHRSRERLDLAVAEETSAREQLHDAIRIAHQSKMPITDIAEAAGVSRQTVYNIVRGKVTPR